MLLILVLREKQRQAGKRGGTTGYREGKGKGWWWWLGGRSGKNVRDGKAERVSVVGTEKVVRGMGDVGEWLVGLGLGGVV